MNDLQHFIYQTGVFHFHLMNCFSLPSNYQSWQFSFVWVGQGRMKQKEATLERREDKAVHYSFLGCLFLLPRNGVDSTFNSNLVLLPEMVLSQMS